MENSSKHYSSDNMSNTLYEELVSVYEKISSTSSRLEKEDIIADFLKSIKENDPDITYDVALLLQGKIFPPWSDKEMGISTQLIIKALSKLLGENTKSIEDKLASVGDMGEITQELVKNNKQVTFFPTSEKPSQSLEAIPRTKSLILYWNCILPHHHWKPNTSQEPSRKN